MSDSICNIPNCGNKAPDTEPFCWQHRADGKALPRHDPINEPPRTREQLPYMGGTTIGCGDHPTAHKRHRWGSWQTWQIGQRRLRHDRTCLNCGLVSEPKYSTRDLNNTRQ